MWPATGAATRPCTVLNATRHLAYTIEQPCWSMEDCMSIRARTGFPLKLDNSLNGIQDILRAYSTDACESVVIQVNKYAGVSQARFARDIAAAAGLGITYATQWGTEITGAVLVHLALTTPPNRFISTLDIHNYSSLSRQRTHGRRQRPHRRGRRCAA
jgi:L-alanine-DL-glutamate epimerase-like enolase superfamily enzyme